MPGMPIANKKPEATQVGVAPGPWTPRLPTKLVGWSVRHSDATSRSATGAVVGHCDDVSKRETVLRGSQKANWMASVEEFLEEARRLDLVSTQGRFRLGDLAEALHHELPEVVDLADRLAIDLEVDRDTIVETWFVAGAFSPETRRPGLPWTTYVSLRFHPARHELADCAAREGWDQERLGQELAALFAARYPPRPETSA